MDAVLTDLRSKFINYFCYKPLYLILSSNSDTRKLEYQSKARENNENITTVILSILQTSFEKFHVFKVCHFCLRMIFAVEQGQSTRTKTEI